MSFDLIDKFEGELASFFGSKYAVATDCCTHAVELSLRLINSKLAGCPERTYISIPMTLIKLNMEIEWQDIVWTEHYNLSGTNVIDAATMWRENSYINGTFTCISFQYKKHLSLGKGGVILTDDLSSAQKLRKMSYDGRNRHIDWMEDNIDSIGYHYYMTPETAALGLSKMKDAMSIAPRIWTSDDYPRLRDFDVFNK